MNSVIVAMLAFALVGAATPGPVNLLATATAVQRGSGEAAKLVVGASLAYALVVYVSGTVMHELVAYVPVLEAVLMWVGSAFLLYLAYQIYTAPVATFEQQTSVTSGWWIGSLTQLLNPKAWLVAMSGISLYVVGQGNPNLWLWVFTFVSLFCCLVGVGFWAVSGRVFAKYLSHPQKQRTFNQVMAVVLVASVSMIWL